MMVYIISLELTYNWECIHFEFHSVTQPSTSGYQKSDIFFCLFVLLSIIDLEHYLVPGTQHSDLILPYILNEHHNV